MAKILRKTHNPYLLGADTHSLTLTIVITTLNQQNVLYGTLRCQEYRTVVEYLTSGTDIFWNLECNNLIT